MENLNPTYRLLLALKAGLESSLPTKIILHKFLLDCNDQTAQDLTQILISIERGKSSDCFMQKLRGIYRQSVYNLVLRGLRGEPILTQVNSLEEEIREACRMEIEAFAATLPMKSLIPLLLFQFPAILLLLVGPFLLQLIQTLK